MGKPEADVEGYLVDSVEALGGLARKVAWIGRRNAPDRFVMLPGENTINFWAECKRLKGAAEDAQAREHTRMRDLGEVVYVINSRAMVDEVLARHMRRR